MADIITGPHTSGESLPLQQHSRRLRDMGDGTHAEVVALAGGSSTTPQEAANAFGLEPDTVEPDSVADLLAANAAAIAAATISTGTVGAPATDVVTVQGIASMTPVLVTAQSGTNNIGHVGGFDYETVAASQSAQILGPTGAQGDYLSHVLIVPATTSPGAVSVTDGNGSAITIFAGGASSVSSLVPFAVPIGAKCTSGTTPGWKVTTGANVSAIGVGDFT
jgi:hypothetical protein